MREINRNMHSNPEYLSSIQTDVIVMLSMESGPFFINYENTDNL